MTTDYSFPEYRGRAGIERTYAVRCPADCQHSFTGTPSDAAEVMRNHVLTCPDPGLRLPAAIMQGHRNRSFHPYVYCEVI